MKVNAFAVRDMSCWPGALTGYRPVCKIRAFASSPIAQSVERRTVNPQVPGSSPGRGANHSLSPLRYKFRAKPGALGVQSRQRPTRALRGPARLFYPAALIAHGFTMSVTLKTPDEVEKMRVAGRLASEVLDYITPHVKAGVTTDELDALCHDYMVKVQGTVPAPLNYAPPGYPPYPKSVCTSVNQVVCHGVPGSKRLKAGDIVNIDVTVIKRRLSRRYQPHVLRRRAVDPGPPPGRDHLRVHVAGHPRGASRRLSGRHRPCHPDPCGSARVQRRAGVLRPRHRPALP